MSDKTHTMGKLMIVRSGESFGLSEGSVKAPRVATISTEQLLPGAVAKRLIDCWNACKGIDPEAVPELLRIAKEILDPIEEWEDSHGGSRGGGQWAHDLRAAIARAGGGE